jgi:hypothetical protein
MLRLCIAVLLALAFPVGASAQVVVVERNVNVRPTPSSDHAPLAKLLPGDEADLLDVPPEDSYLPVRTTRTAPVTNGPSLRPHWDHMRRPSRSAW